MNTEWAYFIGGPFDLTKRPKPAPPNDRYIRLAMEPFIGLEPTQDPDLLARPIPLDSVTYRLMTKVPLPNRDIAWIYIIMSPS